MKKKRGRPSTYSEAIANEICERLAEGEALDAICADAHMPPAPTVRLWVISGAHVQFAADYARARLIGYERFADEVIAISDAPCIGPDGFVDNAAVQRARLMSDNRKWLLSKMLPRQFGDKVTQEIVGDANRPLVNRIELVPIDPPSRLLLGSKSSKDNGTEGG